MNGFSLQLLGPQMNCKALLTYFWIMIIRYQTVIEHILGQKLLDYMDFINFSERKKKQEAQISSDSLKTNLACHFQALQNGQPEHCIYHNWKKLLHGERRPLTCLLFCIMPTQQSLVLPKKIQKITEICIFLSYKIRTRNLTFDIRT